jgi:hypothetical protein
MPNFWPKSDRPKTVILSLTPAADPDPRPPEADGEASARQVPRPMLLRPPPWAPHPPPLARLTTLRLAVQHPASIHPGDNFMNLRFGLKMIKNCFYPRITVK